MGLDARTLATVLLVVCTVLAGLLALTWLQNRNVPAFGMWTISFALCAAAAGFVVAQDSFPGLLAIDIANALRFLALGIALAGRPAFRRPQGETGSLALAPAVLWLAACALSVFGEDLRLRILVASPVVAIGAFAIAPSFGALRRARRGSRAWLPFCSACTDRPLRPASYSSHSRSDPGWIRAPRSPGRFIRWRSSRRWSSRWRSPSCFSRPRRTRSG